MGGIELHESEEPFGLEVAETGQAQLEPEAEGVPTQDPEVVVEIEAEVLAHAADIESGDAQLIDRTRQRQDTGLGVDVELPDVEWEPRRQVELATQARRLSQTHLDGERLGEAAIGSERPGRVDPSDVGLRQVIAQQRHSAHRPEHHAEPDRQVWLIHRGQHLGGHGQIAPESRHRRVGEQLEVHETAQAYHVGTGLLAHSELGGIGTVGVAGEIAIAPGHHPDVHQTIDEVTNERIPVIRAAIHHHAGARSIQNHIGRTGALQHKLRSGVGDGCLVQTGSETIRHFNQDGTEGIQRRLVDDEVRRRPHQGGPESRNLEL